MRRAKQEERTTALIEWRNTLRTVPHRNRAAQVDDLGAGRYRVTVQRSRPAYLIPPVSWVIRPRLRRTMQLEGLGGEVWQMCDGKRDLESITDRFAARHKLTFHEARVAVTGYIKVLTERRILALAQPRSA